MNGIFGHFQITCKSSKNVVSSSKNLKIKVGFPFLNNDENTKEPNALF